MLIAPADDVMLDVTVSSEVTVASPLELMVALTAPAAMAVTLPPLEVREPDKVPKAATATSEPPVTVKLALAQASMAAFPVALMVDVIELDCT
jgi:hypothetical protein